jgi:hypothetical protein
MDELKQRFFFRVCWISLLGSLVIFTPRTSAATEIILENSAVQKLVVEALFTGSQGRMYLLPAPCYVYLEYPTVRLRGGRLIISGHLSGRFGVALGSNCVGPGLASNFTVSGAPTFERGALILGDLQVDQVDDRATDIVRQALFPRLPQAVRFDLQQAVQGLLQNTPGQLQPTLDSLTVLGVTAENDQLVARIDFKLRAK